MRYGRETVRSIRLLCGIVLLLGQFVLQAFGIPPNLLMVLAGLSLMFGVPLLADLEIKRRSKVDDDLVDDRVE